MGGRERNDREGGRCNMEGESRGEQEGELKEEGWKAQRIWQVGSAVERDNNR